MVFTESDLVRYVSSGPVPKDAMIQLNHLLFKELNEYCAACEDDRMICVLSPMCPNRILLKVRIQSGAEQKEIPRFCYSQSVNNIRRFLKKKTTLYTPQDTLIFNKDFFDLMFPHLYNKIISYYPSDLSKVYNLIAKSKVPAVNLNFRSADREMFDKIIRKDKLITPGSFIYDISGEFMIVWFEGYIFISNFQTGITIINAKEDIIQNLRICDLVFHTYLAENKIFGSTILNSEHQMTLAMKIPFSKINPEHLQPDSTFFQEFIQLLEKNFFHIQISEDSQEYLEISLQYQNISHFLKRYLLEPITYDILHNIIIKFSKIQKINK
ncbi:MAG: hypothetical protein ACTSVU_00560 [Promethearchaeota archaeon]